MSNRPLADAGSARMSERSERAAKGEDRAGLVGDRDDAGLQRLARRRVCLGDAAERLRHRVGARQTGMRSLRAVTRDGDIDKPRIYLPQLFVAKAVLLRRAGPEVLPENVSLRDQLAEDFAALRGLQVERQAFDPAIVGFEIGTR